MTLPCVPSNTAIPSPSAEHTVSTSPWMRVWADEPADVPRSAVPPVARERLAPGALAPWWQAGARAALFRPVPGLNGLQAGPAVVACLVLANLLMSLLWERLAIAGPADFHWRALPLGWLDLLVLAWLCAWVRPQGDSAVRLLCLLLGIEFVLVMATGPLWAVLARMSWQPSPSVAYGLSWALWLLPRLWWLVATAVAFRRLGDRHWRPWLLAVAAMIGLQALQWAAPLPRAWSAAASAAQDAEPAGLSLTEPVLQAQSTLLARQLGALKPQRPGVVDVYVLTFAPYGDEDVFRRESAMVADVMSQRFDAAGRTLQLVNHPQTAERLPWATGGNLRQALQGLARLMDPAEDLLFIHLTSHGARDGQLATALWPLQLAPVTPRGLKVWLDEAGIRHRVISISACYSGSWIDPLADPHSLVMTAADAQHTSYGCGRLSELTFFGRAMYDEQLRHATLSFTQAHAAARGVIQRREVEAGKDDGFSNPQIRLGPALKPLLETLRQRLSAAPLRPATVASPQ